MQRFFWATLCMLLPYSRLEAHSLRLKQADLIIRALKGLVSREQARLLQAVGTLCPAPAVQSRAKLLRSIL